MTEIFVWILALLVGLSATYLHGGEGDRTSVLAAWALVAGIWQITRPRFVAAPGDVAKMSHAWTTRHLRSSLRRLAYTVVLALTLYGITRPHWGVAYWLAVAGFYWVGLLLMVRDVRHLTSTPSGPPADV